METQAGPAAPPETALDPAHIVQVGLGFWASKTLLDAIKVIPRAKLVLGIGAYGYDWAAGQKEADMDTITTFHLIWRPTSDAKSQVRVQRVRENAP